MERIAGRGTGNAALLVAAEWVLYLAAAIETILLAGLALLVSRVAPGSSIVPAFLRLNALVLGPFRALPAPSSVYLASIVQQVAAILAYGLVFGLILGGLSWFGRRQALA